MGGGASRSEFAVGRPSFDVVARAQSVIGLPLVTGRSSLVTPRRRRSSHNRS